jgi:hypothetical protein
MWKRATVLVLAATAAALALAAQDDAPKDAEPLPIAEMLRLCHADAKRLDATTQRHVRYLDLHYLTDKKEREKYARILSGHINGLSREPDITKSVAVDAGLWVLRIDLREYRIDPTVYEKLADADKFYHAQVVVETTEEKPWPGGVYAPENKYYAPGAFTLQTKVKKVQKTALAPILTEGAGLALTGDLVTWTGSAVPVLPLEWFLNQTMAAVDRTPNYYDFLGVKNEKDFQKLVGFNEKVAADFGLTELREAVADSGVTLQPRAIRRDEKIGGSLWKTIDFDKAVDRKNPLRVLGKDIEADYTASEQFGHLANGLWATGLFNKSGERQATAPDTIASDSTSKSTDRRVHVCISCLRCHADGGLQSIDGWSRNLFQPPLKLTSPDFDIQKKLKQQYVRKLEPFIEADRQRYEVAIKEATGGWKSGEYAAAFSEAWSAYEDVAADLEWLALRLSTKPETLKAALIAAAKADAIDPVLSVFILDGPRKRTLKKAQVEEIFALAYIALKTYGGK